MNDLIDLGNLVFDALIHSHGANPEDRVLFLYSLTQGTEWHAGENKFVQVLPSGVVKNFEDSEIERLSKDWTDQIDLAKQAIAAQAMTKLKAEPKQFKNGDTFEFWQNEGPWRDINLF